MASMKKYTRVVRHSRGTGNPKVPWSGSDKALLLKLHAEMSAGSTYEQLARKFNASGPQQQRTVNALTKKLTQYRKLETSNATQGFLVAHSTQSPEATQDTWRSPESNASMPTLPAVEGAQIHIPTPPALLEAQQQVLSFLTNGGPDRSVPIVWEFLLKQMDLSKLCCSDEDRATYVNYLNFVRSWNESRMDEEEKI